ncbi:DUF1203 domain-containing protein [Parvularcula marina]|uniref:DUF1203 domain-containing protein n=1 Tax=Parvularcula marina TaxID=2292771 RepID=A0A371RIV1_9PROT|nr:DUF1203 domain-containing protein [Parvularcula marina]RFB05375.1 DUF1203 domain-containing protein [Parvularcula marina]
MSFQIHALPAAPFARYFSMSEEELAANRARRVKATSFPGCPCRVSLEDAAVGEDVILLHYEHQPADSPYRSSHAIYVRPGVSQAEPEEDTIPDQMRGRLLSVRAFGKDDMLTGAEVLEGTELEEAIGRLFANPRAEYLHVHYALPGCYAAKVTRTCDT